MPRSARSSASGRPGSATPSTDLNPICPGWLADGRSGPGRRTAGAHGSRTSGRYDARDMSSPEQSATTPRGATPGLHPELPATVWQVARRPRWIGLLVFALVVSGIFGLLAQWQIERSVEGSQPINSETEVLKPLEAELAPQTAFPERAAAQRVTVTGTMRPGDTFVIGDRVDDGRTGWWLVGRLVDAETGASLPVALGWAETEQEVREAAPDVPPAGAELTVTGRLLPTESPSTSDYEADRVTVVSSAMLVNEWDDLEAGIYNGYVVADDAVGGLQPVTAPAPEAEMQLNWLNIFYAIEWVVFAGFAIFLWFRLVKDRFEREHEEAAEADEEARLAADLPRATAPAQP